MLGRFLSLLRRRRLGADLEDQLRHHRDALEAEYRALGLGPDAARDAASRDMGNVTQVREAFHDQAGLPALEILWRDIRFGARSLRRTPGVTAAVIATLAIGIGANTAIFSVVNGVLLKPLPFPGADALVSVAHRGGVNATDELPSAPYLYFTYRDQNHTFTGVGLWRTRTSTVTGDGAPEQVQTLGVTADVLPLLGVDPLIGRVFSRHDDDPASPPTVLLTYGYWQRRWGGDRTVVGRRVMIDGIVQDVIGVMPRTFRFLDQPFDVLSPLQLDPDQVTLGRYVFPSVARLRPGVSLSEANADVARMVPLAVDRFPAPPGYTREQFATRPVTPHVTPLKDQVVGDISRTLWVLMGALALVLLIACANVANLLLLRTDGRQPELAVRAALGASVRRIATELLVESVMLGLLGGAAGLAVAYAGLRTLVALAPANLPRLDEVALDPVALVFTLVVSLVAGVLFGLLPVVKHASPRLIAAFGTGGRTLTGSRERHRVRGALVIVQVAIALVLLVGSGLMIRTFRALLDVEPGFARPAEVQLVHIGLAGNAFSDPERVTRTQQDLIDRIGAIPGVSSAAFADIPPLGGASVSDTVLIAEGKLYAPGQARPLRRFEFISPGVFHTLGTPVVTGRDFSWTDLYGKHLVALVSDTLARQDWGSAAGALGKRVRASAGDPWREIVGVVGDMHDNGMSQQAPPIVYFPALMDRFWSTPTFSVTATTFLIRSPRAGTESFVHDVQQAVWAVDPGIPLAQVRTLGDAYQRSLARVSFALVMLVTAGGMGLLLGFIGLYGVVAYVVSARAREMGIRLALGAQMGAVRRRFVGHGVLLAAVGVAAGLAASAALTRVMSSLLFGVSPFDPATYAGVAALVIVVAALAAYLPARRAGASNLVDTLRQS